MALRKGYQEAAKAMLKLPLQNDTLIRLTALDPGAQRSKTTVSSLLNLANKLLNVVPDDELGNLDSELRCYTVDATVTDMDAEESDPDFRLDSSWWSRIFQMQSSGRQKYPLLTKLVKALLSIFSGPLIESTFNIMDDIITDNRTSLRVKHYESLVTIKSWLKAKNASATQMKVSEKMKKCVQDSYQTYQSALETDKRAMIAEKEKRLKEAVEMEQARQSKDKSAPTKPSTSVNSANSKLPSGSSKTPTTSATPSKTDHVSSVKANARLSAASANKTTSVSDATPKKKTAEHNQSGATEPISQLPPKANGRDSESATVHPIQQESVFEPETSSPSVSRTAFFNILQTKMEKAECFEDLVHICQENMPNMLQWEVRPASQLFAKDYCEDLEALQLYPSDGPDLHPVSIYGDGNCLPRSGSVLACGKQDLHVEIRVRIVFELCLHEEFYLDNDRLRGESSLEKLPAQYVQVSSHWKQGESISPETVKRVYRRELQDAVKDGSYMGIWQLHALASVLGCKLFSVYPMYGGHTVRSFLHRLLYPREKISASGTTTMGIMWTNMNGRGAEEQFWQPNHFVACLPGQTADPVASCKKKRKASYDIRDFFKKPRKN